MLRSDDYTEPWGVPPNEVPEGLRGKFTSYGGPGNGPVEYHEGHLACQCCRENVVLKEQVERLTAALADSYLTIDKLRRELASVKDQHEIDVGVQDKLYQERDDALHQAERLTTENSRLERHVAEMVDVWHTDQAALREREITIGELRRELDSLKDEYDTTGLPGDDSIPIAERRAAKAALDALPEQVRGFWSPQFQLIPDTGDFVGLSCKVCNKWQKYAHGDDCPVAGIDKLVKGASQ